MLKELEERLEAEIKELRRKMLHSLKMGLCFSVGGSVWSLCYLLFQHDNTFFVILNTICLCFNIVQTRYFWKKLN